MQVRLETETFQATIKTAVGGRKILEVEGQTDFVEVDYKIKLARAVPQGINPFDLLLKLEVQPPTGVHSNALAKRTIRYDEDPAEAEHRTVTIGNGEQIFTVTVV